MIYEGGSGVCVCVWGGGGGLCVCVCGGGGGLDLIKLAYLFYVFGKTMLGKQCRPRSDAAKRGVSLGSTQFATRSAILYTFTGK